MNKAKFGVIASLTHPDTLGTLQLTQQEQMPTSIEVRLDSEDFSDIELNAQRIARFIGKLPIILTYRSEEDGGPQVISLERQWLYWATLPPLLRNALADSDLPVYADWTQELRALDQLSQSRTVSLAKNWRLISQLFSHTGEYW